MKGCKRFRVFVLFIILFFLFLSTANAYGPKKVAKTDRSLWPYAVNSPLAFDFASKMEILVFTEQLISKENIKSKAELKKYLGLKRVETSSVEMFRSRIWNILVKNYKAASLYNEGFLKVTKPVDKYSLTELALNLETSLPDKLRPWYERTRMFYSSYLYEQMRLAALFPRITSEIMVLDQSEIQGFEKNDKSFLFTFDDGPTRKNGNTDKLIKVLAGKGLKGIFFVLGEKLERRIKKGSVLELKELYQGMNLSSHGMIHKSHQRYKGWKKSLYSTENLINSIQPVDGRTLFFRPPYGQRKIEIIDYLKAGNSKLMLWNIDSQDWNRKISAKETAHRVISLMLLFRKGIILYHDVYPKAQKAVPFILKYFKGAKISF